jgi:hypothetical protein
MDTAAPAVVDCELHVVLALDDIGVAAFGAALALQPAAVRDADLACIDSDAGYFIVLLLFIRLHLFSC